MITSVLELAILILGLVVAVMLRRRDGQGALLLALGFGCELVAVIISVAEAVVSSALIESTLHSGGIQAMQALIYGFGLVIRLVSIGGYILVFLGMLRLVRRRPGAAPSGMGAAR